MPSELDDVIDDRPAADQAATASATPPATPQTPPATPPAATPDATPAATPPADGATPAAAATPAATQQAANMREYARSLGIDPSQFGDDQALVQALVHTTRTQQQQLAEAQRYAQYGRLWIDQQAKLQQPATAPADPLAAFKAPEFDPRWQSQVIRDPATGELKLAPGADPTILPKLHAYQQHREKISNQFLENPVEFLKPIISALVGQQGQQLVDTRIQALQEQQYTDSFIAQNRGWLYAHDSTGKPVLDMGTRQPILSDAGAKFTRHLQFGADVLGIQGTQRQEHYARTALAAEMAQPAIATQQAVQTGQQQQQNVLNNLNRNNPNRSGSTVGVGTGHQAPPQQNSSLSLRDQLAADLQAAGLTDADVNADLVR